MHFLSITSNRKIRCQRDETSVFAERNPGKNRVMQNLYNRRPNTLTINNHKNPENITHINALELPKEKWDKRCPNGFNTYHCYRNTGLKAESKRAMIAILDKILATTSY